MSALVGHPSDQVPEILGTGRGGITTVFVSMSGRHPEGRDADYLEWHGLDHQPEQHRLGSLRASLRLVSTPACRAARPVNSERYRDVDHVMTYFFSDTSGLEAFNELNMAMAAAGRTPYLLPLVERGVFQLEGGRAADRIKVGADVLAWWPATGVFLLIEEGHAPPGELVEVPGVGGAWWSSGLPIGPPYSTAEHRGLQMTYCFLDGDLAETAGRMAGALRARWAETATVPLLAAPFHTVVRHQWGRYVP